MLIQYLGMLLVVLAGPLVGMLLVRTTPDERALGEHWFLILRYILIGIFGFLELWLSRSSPLQASLLAAGVLVFLACRTLPRVEHALVGIAFWFATRQPYTEAAVLLLFLLGVVGGTLAATPKLLKQKRFWQMQLRAYPRIVWPVLIAVALYALGVFV